MVFTVSQIYLSDAISGRDKVLSDLKKQINELSKILVTETEKKQEALSSLSQTQEKLGQTKPAKVECGLPIYCGEINPLC